MKKIALLLSALVVSGLLVVSAHSAEITYNPSTQFYDMNGNGVLSLWGVPEANGNALVANPDSGNMLSSFVGSINQFPAPR